MWELFHLPDQPRRDGTFTFQWMMLGWMNIMIPAAFFAWTQTKSVSLSLISFVASPAISIMQGAAGMLYYRANFGDSPHPVTPAHGVVVVNPRDRKNEDKEEDGSPIVLGTKGCACQHGQRWRRGGPLSLAARGVMDEARADNSPIRMLVIGDSLALGVGTKKSCSPMLPEVIARTISKSLGGKPVFWTSHGFPGASAAWVVRELERGMHYLYRGGVGSPGLELSDSSSEDSVSESGSDATDEEEETSDWTNRLRQHGKHFTPNVTGPYDIVVVMTAANDLKAAMFPFLLQGEDSDFRQDAKRRGGSYRVELERLLDRLAPCMKTKFGCKKTMDQCRKTRPLQPLVVFPGMPAHALPCFRKYPLQFLSIPVVALMDNHKRAVAKAYPEQVLYVEPPPIHDIALYENQTGHHWEEREKEDTLLSLRDVRSTQCETTENTMRAYYDRKGKQYGVKNFDKEPTSSITQTNEPVPKLSCRPGRPGERIFCLDGVHPNDEGYDFWGRFIANGILNAWSEWR